MDDNSLGNTPNIESDKPLAQEPMTQSDPAMDFNTLATAESSTPVAESQIQAAADNPRPVITEGQTQPVAETPTPIVPGIVTFPVVKKSPKKKLIIIIASVAVLGGLVLTFFLTNGFGLMKPYAKFCDKITIAGQWSIDNSYFALDPNDFRAGSNNKARAEKLLELQREAYSAVPDKSLRESALRVLDSTKTGKIDQATLVDDVKNVTEIMKIALECPAN